MEEKPDEMQIFHFSHSFHGKVKKCRGDDSLGGIPTHPLLKSHLDPPAKWAGGNFLERIVRGLFSELSNLATVSDKSVITVKKFCSEALFEKIYNATLNVIQSPSALKVDVKP